MHNLAIYLKKFRKECVLAPLFKLLEALFDLLVPLVVAKMIDSNALGMGKKYMFIYFGTLIAMAIVGLAFSIVAQFFSAKASCGFAGSLRQALFDHIQGFSFAELDRLGSDTLITRLSDDVNQVQTGLNMGLRLLLRSPFIVFGAMIMAFTIDTTCALVFAVAIPVLLAVTFLIMKVSIPLFGRVQSGLDRVTALTRENLTGVRVIRAFCHEEEAVEEFERSNKALTKLNIFVGKVSALLNPLTYVLINIAAAVLIGKAAVRVELGALQQGEVVALYNYMLQIIVELIKLAALIITLNKSLACAKRVSGILDVKPSMKYEAGTAEDQKPTQPVEGSSKNTPANTPAVEFSSVTFTYPGAAAPSLLDIDFKAYEGQTVGVIGGTGSGKSTLVNLIPRFYDVDEGAVSIDGGNVKKLSKAELCEATGVVPQKAVLFKGSIRDNMRFGNEEASDDDIWKALETAQAKEIVEKKPGMLDFEIEQGGKNLSGGQKQRLTIARALVKKPRILILDDSSSALDFATDAALRKAIHALHGTTFIVSQRIACVRQSDLILVLDNGTLAGKGTHEELMSESPVYQDIYYSQFPEERNASNERNAKEAMA